MNPPTESAAIVIAAAVVDALERAEAAEESLGLEELCDEVPELPGGVGAGAVKGVLIAAACRCAAQLSAGFRAEYPNDDAPLVALRAAEAWLLEPTEALAARAAESSAAALNTFASLKGDARRAAWPRPAWFARACAWLSGAPRYDWQAVAAIHGLVRAGSLDLVRSELAHAIAMRAIPKPLPPSDPAAPRS